MTALVDAEARRRIREEFGATFFVEAAAGTGKTTALVGRIVGLISAGAGTLNRIVAVTFTEKAAGEMKLRVRSEIEKARSKATREERDRLDRALEELELARIGTIHAFCGDLLHERPIEAGIDHDSKSPRRRKLMRSQIWLSRIGFKQFSRIRPRASVASLDADRVGSRHGNSCEAQCGRFASTATFRHGGDARPSTETARSTT